MADTQPNPAGQTGANTEGNDGDILKYWCHMCNKVVDIPSNQEAVDGEIHCSQCGDSFVELYEGEDSSDTNTAPASAQDSGTGNNTGASGATTGIPNPTTVTPLTQLLHNLTNSLAASMNNQGAAAAAGGGGAGVGGAGGEGGQGNTGDEDDGDSGWETASESPSEGDSDYGYTDDDDMDNEDPFGLGMGQQGAGNPNPLANILQMLTGGQPGNGLNLQFDYGPGGWAFHGAAGAGAAGGGTGGPPAPAFDPFAALLNLSNQQFPGMGGQGVNMGDYYHGPGFEQFISQFIDHDNPFGTPPTDPAYLETMKEETLSAEQLKEAPECHVCMDAFTAEDKVFTLPCEHTFHTSCLSPWLKDHSNCPSCRYQLPWQGMPQS
eukprot:TRINITY_DN1419_c0_g3_i1.p1 TRINITY_DN1419_c0_g3~~TRINITY_DN1419_c0_g3_i1.p1  ORF type:complete len:378 (+),score=68.30 TRINITY_DN1419_c0_g3_i1:204-1337(+)